MTTKVIGITCAQCKGSLESFPIDDMFICRYCGTVNIIERSGSVQKIPIGSFEYPTEYAIYARFLLHGYDSRYPEQFGKLKHQKDLLRMHGRRVGMLIKQIVQLQGRNQDLSSYYIEVEDIFETSAEGLAKVAQICNCTVTQLFLPLLPDEEALLPQVVAELGQDVLRLHQAHGQLGKYDASRHEAWSRYYDLEQAFQHVKTVLKVA